MAQTDTYFFGFWNVAYDMQREEKGLEKETAIPVMEISSDRVGAARVFGL